ncbi:unnamed protein product [Cuscuta campestris]|uniref:Uncharacterized protein n=1 Tax=Cuscuta campestris TaxID=132261 RepID=A0A484KGX4_9ASTE|nr:unnamed protein product [Cuscuta campestris]
MGTTPFHLGILPRLREWGTPGTRLVIDYIADRENLADRHLDLTWHRSSSCWHALFGNMANSPRLRTMSLGDSKSASSESTQFLYSKTPHLVSMFS